MRSTSWLSSWSRRERNTFLLFCILCLCAGSCSLLDSTTDPPWQWYVEEACVLGSQGQGREGLVQAALALDILERDSTLMDSLAVPELLRLDSSLACWEERWPSLESGELRVRIREMVFAIQFTCRGSDHPETVRARLRLGMVCVEQGLTERAESLLRDVNRILREAAGLSKNRLIPAADLSYGADLAIKLARHYVKRSEPDRAELILDETAQVLGEYAGTGNEGDIGRLLLEKSQTRLTRGDPPGAVTIAEVAQQVLGENLGPQSPDYLDCLDLLVALHDRLGEYDRAERYRLERDRILLTREERTSEDRMQAILASVKALWGENRNAEAEAACRNALKTAESIFGPDHLEVAACWTLLGDILRADGRFPQADSSYRRAVEIHRKLHGEPDLPPWRNLYGLARTAWAVGREAESGGRFYDIWTKNLLILYDVLGSREEQEALGYSWAVKDDAALTLSVLTDLKEHGYDQERMISQVALSTKGLVHDAMLLRQREGRRWGAVDECDWRRERVSPGQIIERVQAALPPNTALVTYLKYSHSQCDGACESRYLAVVVDAEGGARPVRLMHW
ncbi:tetratricopeptide repeat protein [bacterium]|nr:tetratricopeptide repeat protein [bacterium]MBU1984757.1 tetratricopeptide repeat protein [bacterium]